MAENGGSRLHLYKHRSQDAAERRRRCREKCSQLRKAKKSLLMMERRVGTEWLQNAQRGIVEGVGVGMSDDLMGDFTGDVMGTAGGDVMGTSGGDVMMTSAGDVTGNTTIPGPNPMPDASLTSVETGLPSPLLPDPTAPPSLAALAGPAVDVAAHVRHLVRLRKEAPWRMDVVVRLAKIAHSAHAHLLIDCDAVPPLMELLIQDLASQQIPPSQRITKHRPIMSLSPSPSPSSLKLPAILALGGLSASSEAARQYLIRQKLFPSLFLLLLHDPDPYVTQEALFCLAQFCGSLNGDLSVVYRTLFTVLSQHEHHAVLAAAASALHNYLACGRGEVRVEKEVAARLVSLLGHESLDVVTPTLWVVTELLSRNDGVTETLLECSLIPALIGLHTQRPLQEKLAAACLHLTAHAAPNPRQLDPRPLDSRDHMPMDSCHLDSPPMNPIVVDVHPLEPLFPFLIGTLHTGTHEAKESAISALNNVATSGTEAALSLLRQGCLGPMCALLTDPDLDTVFSTLCALNALLHEARKEARREGRRDGMREGRHCVQKAYLDEIEENRGEVNLQMLQLHQNTEISKLASFILENFFHRAGREDE